MKSRCKSIALCVFIALLAGALPARAEQDFVDYYRMNRAADQGAELFHQGKYDLARAGYMRAKDMADEKSDESLRLHYNIGDTFYKEGNYADAEKEFQQALAADDTGLREQAYYNLGNVYFKQGMKDQKIETLEKAVENYQKALELNPDDEDAKFNIEVVRRNIKLKKQQQQQQQPSPSPSPNPSQSQQGQQGQEQQQPQAQSGQEQKKPGEQGEEEKKKEERSAEPQPSAGSTAGKEAKPEQSVTPQGAAKPGAKMNEEEAKRLLQAVEQNETEDMKKVMESYQGRRPAKDKDW